MNRKKNKNGIRFLIFLIVFGFVAIRFGGSFSNDMKVESWSEEVVEIAEQECATCGTIIEEQVPMELGYEILEMEDGLIDITALMNGDEDEVAYIESLIAEGGEEVLGLSDWWDKWKKILSGLVGPIINNWTGLGHNFLTCGEFNSVLTLESSVQICHDEHYGAFDTVGANDNLIEYNGQVFVDVNSRAVFTKVTYPLAYFLGQYVFERSTRAISYRSTEYSANGENIEVEYFVKTMSPGFAAEFAEEVENLGTNREPFAVNASIAFGDPAGKPAAIEDQKKGSLHTKIEVINEEEAIGPCDSFARYDYNPETANHMSVTHYNATQVPGGNNYELPEDNECYEEGKDFDMSPWGNVPACFNILESAMGLFSYVFDRDVWDECTVGECTEITLPDGSVVEKCENPNPDKCIDTAVIGVEMAPLFGKPYECDEPFTDKDGSDGLCANALLTERYRGTLSPDIAGGKRVSGNPDSDGLMYFIGTPCQISVTSDNRGPFGRGVRRLIDVVCLWDATPNHLNYKLQAKDRYPGQEDFPQTFRDYWKGVLQAIEVSTPKYWDL
jgi:hypothetical protein